MFRTPAFYARCRFFFQPPCQLLYDDELLNELDEVVHRPKHWNIIDKVMYSEIMQLLIETGRKVNVHSVVDVCRDPDDNYLLALAKDGAADYLITGDDDLLVLKKFGKTKIMQLTGFIELLKNLQQFSAEINVNP